MPFFFCMSQGQTLVMVDDWVNCFMCFFKGMFDIIRSAVRRNLWIILQYLRSLVSEQGHVHNRIFLFSMFRLAGQQIPSLPWSQVPVLQLTCWLELLSRNYMMMMTMAMKMMMMMVILYSGQFSAEESWLKGLCLGFCFGNALYMNCFHLSTYVGSPSRGTPAEVQGFGSQRSSWHGALKMICW